MGRVEAAGLAAEISKGRLLSQVRETLVTQCSEGWEAEFKRFLKGHDLTPAKALKLIQLAGNAEEAFGDDAEQVADRMTRQAFYLAVDAGQEVRQLVKQQALESETVLKKGDVAAIRNEWDIVTSEILPESVKEKVQNGSLLAPKVAPLVKELNESPEEFAVLFAEEIAASDGFDADELKEVTKDIKGLNKVLNELPLVTCLANLNNDAIVGEILKESLYIDLVSKVTTRAEQVQRLATKLYQSHRKLSKEVDRLYCETGASTPHLRRLIAGLDSLAGETIRIETDKFSFSYSLQAGEPLKVFVQAPQQNDGKGIEQEFEEQEQLDGGDDYQEEISEQSQNTQDCLTDPTDDFPSEENDPKFFEELYGPVQDELIEVENNPTEKKLKNVEFTEITETIAPQPAYYEFVDFMGKKIMVDSINIGSVDPQTVEECKNLLKAAKTTDDIWDINAAYEQSLNGSFSSLKYAVAQDEEVTRHIFLVRLASDLQKTAGFYQEEKDIKANGKEVEISWATSKLEELRRIYPNDIKPAMAFLGRHDVAAYVLLKELSEVMDEKQKAKAKLALAE
jgi:hypothetical protein